MKITEYPTAQFLDEGDVLIKDGTNGTKQIKASDLVYALFDNIPQMHREIFRGKSLGSTYTADQKEAISSGTFHDLWIGDYWTINGHKYYIADFDLYYNTGDSTNYNQTHHAVVILEGGADQTSRVYGTPKSYYPTSSIRTEGLAESKSMINAAFPDSVLTYRSELISSAGNSENTVGVVGGQIFTCDVELLRVEHIASTSKIAHQANANRYDSQFKLFELDGANFSNYFDSTVNPDDTFFTSSPDWRLPEDFSIMFNKKGYCYGSQKTGSSKIFAFFLLKG